VQWFEFVACVCFIVFSLVFSNGTDCERAVHLVYSYLGEDEADGFDSVCHFCLWRELEVPACASC